MILRHRNTIAGAVTRAILRAEADPGYLVAESAAYKCALVDQGCSSMRLCEDAARDYEVMLTFGRAVELLGFQHLRLMVGEEAVRTSC